MKTIIDQVIEADEKMTKAPWIASIDEHESAVVGTSPRCSPVVVCTMANFADIDGHYRYNQPSEDDCSGIAFYRTAAPILARRCELLERNLQKAMDALELSLTSLVACHQRNKVDLGTTYLTASGEELLGTARASLKHGYATIAEIQKEIKTK